MWNHSTGGHFLVEFSASDRAAWKRHALKQIGSSIAVLLPTEDAIYDIDWWSPSSRPHNNDDVGVFILKRRRQQWPKRYADRQVPVAMQQCEVAAEAQGEEAAPHMAD